MIKSLIEKYGIQLWDKNTLSIAMDVPAKDLLQIDEHKGEILTVLKVRQKVEQAAASEFQDKIDAIPGLKEVEAILDDMVTLRYIPSDEMLSEYDFQAMEAKYPKAFAYLKAREYERSANRIKAQAGHEAVVKIVNGEDYQVVIAEMEESVAEHISL